MAIALLFGASGSAPAAPAEPFLSAVERERARPAAAPLPRQAFTVASNLADVRLSPNGKQVAFLRRGPAAQSLWLLDTSSGARRQILRRSDATRLHWSADSLWLFLESPRQLIALSLASRTGSGVITSLGGKTGRSLIRTDMTVANSLLIAEEQRRPGESRALAYRVLRLTPGRPARTLLTSPYRIMDFIAGKGRDPAFAKLETKDGFSIRRIDRARGAREMFRCLPPEPCAFLSSPAAGELLLLGRDGDLGRLIRFDRFGNRHVLHQDPEGVSDLATVSIDAVSGQALLAGYRSVDARSYPLDARMRLHAATIGRGLGEDDFTLSVGSAGQWLVREAGDRLQHPRWHLYDPGTRRLHEILADIDRSAWLVPEGEAARKIPFSHRASDGFLLHGFLSLPPGAQSGRIPLIVDVHGGPQGHVQAGYSATTQFLVNRGYAVFEPNFRGSTGYGRAYMLAAGSDFGNGRVQRDIVEGTRFLLAHDIGDPMRVGIIGHSFGGYSSLLGVTFAPDLFRVAVAAMPSSDFLWMLDWQMRRDRTRADRLGMAAILHGLGMNIDDPVLRARLQSQSPLANVGLMRRPVLILAGGADRNVPIRSVVDYAARLRTLGRDVSLFVDSRSGHGIERPDMQEQYLFLLGRMLGAHLGGPKEALPLGEARRQLRRNLRVASIVPGGDPSRRLSVSR